MLLCVTYFERDLHMRVEAAKSLLLIIRSGLEANPVETGGEIKPFRQQLAAASVSIGRALK